MDIEVIEQRPVSLAEVGNLLESIKDATKEPGFRIEKVKTYVAETTSLKSKEAEDLYKKLESLGIQKIKEKHLVKVVDVLPEDLDSLKALFSGETVTLKQEELNKILETLNNR